MLTPIYRLVLKLLGWKIEIEDRNYPPKFVVIVAPHTSGWDFVIGIMASRVIGMGHAKYLGKAELFKFPLGILMRGLGGYPVIRKSSQNYVQAVVDIFNQHERFAIALSPEGTRQYIPKWKSGFYYIALNAKVPIIMASLDYSKKLIQIKKPLSPSGDFEKDMAFIMDNYRGVQGKIPENGVR